MSRLEPGDSAPDFTATSTRGKLELSDYQGRWLVLYFYPKDDTPGCTKEACDFRDRLPGMDAEVLGVSPDSLNSHETFRGKYGLAFPLIADEDHALAEAYGAWGEKKNYGRVYQGLIRSTFIIDPEGTVREAMYNVRASGHAERVAKKLEALQR